MKKNIQVLAYLIVFVTLLISGIVLVFNTTQPIEKIDFMRQTASTLFDSSGQRFAHQIALITLLLSSLLGMVLLRSARICQILHLFVHNVNNPTLLGVFIAITGIPSLLLGTTPLLFITGAVIGSGLFIFMFIRLIQAKITYLGQIGIISLFIFFFVVLGMFYTPTYPTVIDLVYSLPHYESVFLGDSSRLASGQILFETVKNYYGILIPSFLAAIQYDMGYFFDFGQYIKIVQFSQLLFLALALINFYLWKPNNFIFLLFTVLFVACYHLSTNNIAAHILFPNLSGLRYLDFPIAIFFLLLSRTFSLSRTALLLGFVSGYLILLNPETAICIVVGYIVFFLSRLPAKPIYYLFIIISLFISSLLLAIVSFIGIFFVIFNYYPIPANLWDFLGSSVGAAQNGYIGLPLYFDIVMFTIGFHSLWTVARLSLCWSYASLSVRDSHKLAIAVILLIWFAYYINRPYPAGLLGYLFLYTFLIADFFNLRFIRRFRKKGAFFLFSRPHIALLSFIFIPFISLNCLVTLVLHNNSLLLNIQAEKNTLPLGGILLPKALTPILEMKAHFLRQQTEKVLTLSLYNGFISILSKQYMPLPYSNVYAVVTGEEGHQQLNSYILVYHPKRIVFDALSDYEQHFLEKTEMPLASDYAVFYQSVTRLLVNQYHLVGEQAGWVVWEQN
ncbi:hypothetical protein [Beggiatoa leptomitoformis]|uniref:Glycosyltransferase RgtA/B/C/D-like domain-containing protein n=1 Tax=Beggiatoa leptomitoformis TaxID=288004 RepID=A0A2N9YG96_9GAMM|nr:hypothetical protein [Beggiatoa leptomitoformis]ALG68193.1 hypothetical protein AL038_11340 [Beggiatoa leptomitoformis]AUI69503.1 hypothetical protein BLE401_12930 [Beggiatoa leptomitoformis]